MTQSPALGALETSPEVRSNAGKHPRFFWAAPRTPVQPGHFLETRYLRPGKISQEALAEAIGISRRRVNELVRGKRVITADTAVRLAQHFGTDVAFWLELQFAWDLHQTQQLYYKQVKTTR
ncbi:HigA family addiction module antitoxin [Sideroxydans sp. CL21]|uniref:HigA family addiction module antitoxin n=1 Tax=Sideroxydans sp. CL21 TaxID=2600596 RepID=UPI0024BD2DDD|nr:HigA family addiction module antitoxin [Sideroxydans sp. CL21]